MHYFRFPGYFIPQYKVVCSLSHHDDTRKYESLQFVTNTIEDYKVLNKANELKENVAVGKIKNCTDNDLMQLSCGIKTR